MKEVDHCADQNESCKSRMHRLGWFVWASNQLLFGISKKLGIPFEVLLVHMRVIAKWRDGFVKNLGKCLKCKLHHRLIGFKLKDRSRDTIIMCLS
jgi:hypothetical protein